MRTYFAPVLFILLMAACKDNTTTGIPDKGNNQVTQATEPVIQLQPPKSGKALQREPIVATVKQIQTHIPDGYSIMDTCSGDLNGDALTDYLLVLRLIGEDSLARATESSDTFIKRRLLILTGQSGQTYKLAAQSDNVIDCVDCGGELGEPYQGLVIKNGYFSVKHYGGSAWRWTRFVTFKYATADSAWYLHKDGKGSFNFGEPDEKGTIKIRTIKDFGKVAFADFDIYRNWFE